MREHKQMQRRTLDEVGDGAGAAVLHDELRAKAVAVAVAVAVDREWARVRNADARLAPHLLTGLSAIAWMQCSASVTTFHRT